MEILPKICCSYKREKRKKGKREKKGEKRGTRCRFFPIRQSEFTRGLARFNLEMTQSLRAIRAPLLLPLFPPLLWKGKQPIPGLRGAPIKGSDLSIGNKAGADGVRRAERPGRSARQMGNS